MKKLYSVIFAIFIAVTFGATAFAADYYNEDIGLSLDVPADSYAFYPEMTEEYYARYDDRYGRSYRAIMNNFAESKRVCEIYYNRDGRMVDVYIDDDDETDFRSASDEELQYYLNDWADFIEEDAEIFEKEIYRTKETAFIKIAYHCYDDTISKEVYITYANTKQIRIYLYSNGRNVTGDESAYVKKIVDSIKIANIENTKYRYKKPAEMVIVYTVLIAVFAGIIVSTVKKKEGIETAPEKQDYTSEEQNYTSEKQISSPFEKASGGRKYCTLCGAKLKKGSSFCQECGAPVEK